MNINEYKEHRDRLKNDPQYALKCKQEKEQEVQNYWMSLEKFQKAEDVPALPVMNNQLNQELYLSINLRMINGIMVNIEIANQGSGMTTHKNLIITVGNLDG